MIYDRKGMQEAYLASVDPHYEPSHPGARAAKAAMEIERSIAKRSGSSPSSSGGSAAIGWIVIAIIVIAACGGG